MDQAPSDLAAATWRVAPSLIGAWLSHASPNEVVSLLSGLVAIFTGLLTAGYYIWRWRTEARSARRDAGSRADGGQDEIDR